MKRRNERCYLQFHLLMLLLAAAYLLAMHFDRVEKKVQRLPKSCVLEECEVQVAGFPGTSNFVYLRYTGINQNFKHYASSFDPKIFKDDINPSATDVKSCRPYTTNEQMGRDFDLHGNPLNPKEVAVPCGTIAYTFPQSSRSSPSRLHRPLEHRPAARPAPGKNHRPQVQLHLEEEIAEESLGQPPEQPPVRQLAQPRAHLELHQAARSLRAGPWRGFLQPLDDRG